MQISFTRNELAPFFDALREAAREVEEKCGLCELSINGLTHCLVRDCPFQKQINDKEGNKMSEHILKNSNDYPPITTPKPELKLSEETKQFQTSVNKFRFVFILAASQLQGLAGAFKRKDAKLSAWFFWAGQAIYAFVNGVEIPQEPTGIDDFDSPFSDAVANWLLTIGYQLRSLGAAIAMYDQDDLGKDDAFAHLLQRIASVLITLGNK